MINAPLKELFCKELITMKDERENIKEEEVTEEMLKELSDNKGDEE